MTAALRTQTPGMRLIHASRTEIEGLYCPLPPARAGAPAPYASVLAWMGTFDLAETKTRESYASVGATFAVDNYPLASPLGHELMARLFVLGFYFDDVYCEPLSNGARPRPQDRTLFEDTADCMIDTIAQPGSRPVIDLPVTAATADLALAIDRHYPRILVTEMADGWRRWIAGLRWELSLGGAAPPLAQFFPRRIDNFGAWLLTVLGAAGSGLDLDESSWRSPVAQAMIHAGWTLVIMYNEWASYDKEVRNGTGSTNLVQIIARERGSSLDEAVAETARLHDRVMTVFLALTGQCRGRGEPLTRWADFMEGVVAGHIAFCSHVCRYAWPPGSQVILLDHPGADAGAALIPAPIRWWWREAGLPLGNVRNGGSHDG